MNREVCLWTEASFGLSESVGFLCHLLPPMYLFLTGEPGLCGLAWIWPFLSFLLRTQVQVPPPSTLLLMVLTTE